MPVSIKVNVPSNKTTVTVNGKQMTKNKIKSKSFGTWNSPIHTNDMLRPQNLFSSKLILDNVTGHGYYRHIDSRKSELLLKVTAESIANSIPFITNQDDFVPPRMFAVNDGIIVYQDPKDNNVYTYKNNEHQLVAEFELGAEQIEFHPDGKHVLVLLANDFPGPYVANYINLESGNVEVWLDGNTFEAFSFSPDGSYVSWVYQEHFGKKKHICVGTIEGLKLTDIIQVNEIPELCSGPVQWHGLNAFCYIGECGNYRQIKTFDIDTKVSKQVSSVNGDCLPADDWDPRPYMSLLYNELYFVFNDAGNETIGKIDLNTNEYTKITDEFCAIGGIRVVQFGDRAILTLRASQFDKPASLFGLDLSTKEVLQFATSYDVQDLKGYISEHQYFTFPTRDGSSSYLYYYPPTNPDYTGLDGELPPCIVYCHGGPNELARCGFDWEVQYVTSRGFAYVAVNYGGTPSFGKHHLERLDKLVGVVDVADTCDAAKYLASIGLVDRERLLVEGISAGGYITNCCLMFEPDVFKAGCSSCGLSDMKIMVENYKNHPLSSVGEPFYIDFYGGKPEDIPEVYYNRSPLNFTEKFKGSLLLTHAKDDKNVAYEHTQALYDRLKEAGKSVELLPFATGGHPFFDIPEMKAVIFERKVPFYLESFTK